jgi:hypothetical protein
VDSRVSSYAPPRAGQNGLFVEALLAVCLFHPQFPPFVIHVGVIFLLRANWGYGRQIPNPVRERNEKILVHRSVKTRMDADCLKTGKYHPKATFELCEVEWVD